MEEPILLNKSTENMQAAKLLSNNKLYNAATSRKYYSAYQKAIYILDKHKIDYQKDGHSSHYKTIGTLIKHVAASKEDEKILRKLNNIRVLRNNCDYKHDFLMSKEKYDSEIKSKILNIDQVLNKYC